MQFLLEIVAHELPDSEDRLLLYVEDLVIRQDIRVLVEVESYSDPVDLILVVPELVVLYL